MTNEASALVDTDAANKAADADMALQELGATMPGMAYVTGDRHRLGRRPAHRRRETAPLVEKVIQGRDFTAMPRPSTRRLARQLLPGHAYANVRQPPITSISPL